MTQNGMVYTRIDVLPAPPCNRATWTRTENRAVCSRPNSATRGQARMRMGRRNAFRTSSSATAPSKVRSAEKSKGPA